MVSWKGVVVLLAFLGCGSGNGSSSLAGRLPASNEIGSWQRSEPPLLVDTETAFYGQIDGAAPKYIDRGWVASVYAYYQQGGSTVSVAIHDMGTTESAASIFNFDLPVSRIAINEIPDPYAPSALIANAVIDLALATAYRGMAYTDRFYIEVSIDDRSDAALEATKAFTLKILER